MLTSSQFERVYLARGSTDLRKSIDGLAVIVKECFELDPFSPCLFVFCNRKRDKLKILQWEHNGFWLHYRRLERGTFHWPSEKEETLITANEMYQPRHVFYHRMTKNVPSNDKRLPLIPLYN